MYSAPAECRLGGAELSGFGILLQVLEHDLEVGHVLPPALGVFTQAAGESLCYVRGKRIVDLSGRLWILVEDGCQRGHTGFPAEGLLAREHLVENGAEGENVGAGVDFFALGLLR